MVYMFLFFFKVQRYEKQGRYQFNLQNLTLLTCILALLAAMLADG